MTAVTETDRQTLRRLAARVAEIAALPEQPERARLWRGLNGLRPERPMVLAFPEGGWTELVPADEMTCADPLLRDWERVLRMWIFRHEHIGDDHPVVPFFDMRPVVEFGDYGLSETRTRSTERGSYHWDPPLKELADFARLHPRPVRVDRAENAHRLELAGELFGDLLEPRLHGMIWWTVGLTQQLVYLRGLDQMMLDTYDNSRLLHDLMALLRDSTLAEIEYLEAEGVLSLNNGPADYVGSGGLGCTDELPADDFDGTVRLKDMWGLAESQETVGISPDAFAEFILPYQKPLMDRFGLVCYGCCEPIDKRIDLVREAAPHLRRASVSPWCDRQVAAEKLGREVVFSWKPNPAPVCAPRPDWDQADRDIRETLRIADGCAVEMILKDTHTFHNDPTRAGHWVALAREAIEDSA